jgi:hypothetical protein
VVVESRFPTALYAASAHLASSNIVNPVNPVNSMCPLPNTTTLTVGPNPGRALGWYARVRVRIWCVCYLREYQSVGGKEGRHRSLQWRTVGRMRMRMMSGANSRGRLRNTNAF